MIERDDYRELDEWLDRSLTDRGKAGIAFLVIVALDILAWIVIIITVIELWRHLT